MLPLFVFLPAAGGAPTALAGTPVDLSLWIHRDDTLSMAGNGNEFGTPQTFTSRVWRMSEGLQKDLCIDGVDIGSGRQGFAVQLSLGFFTFTSGVNLTMRVKDIDFVLAEDSFAFARNSAPFNALWNLNFTSGRTGCTVLKGHTLALEITSPNTISTTGDFRSAHISMRVTDPVSPTAQTANAAGPTSAFYPNDLTANRTVFFSGALGNAFTDALISRVTVQVRDPLGGLVADATGVVSLGNWTFNWNYPPSTPGAYSAFIQVNDTQGHSYNATVSFSFVNYGLRITTQDQVGDSATRYTTQGVAADYDLAITNVGGSPTAVLLVTETVLTGWSATFTSNNIPLDPAVSGSTTMRVTPSLSVGPGNSTQIVLIAQASSDPSPLKARATLTTTTIIQSEISLVFDPPRTDSSVKLGAAASYSTTIRNNGGKATDILFNATAPPSGWDRVLSSAGLVDEGAGGWRLVGVEAGGERQLTLEVFAPADSGNTTTFECTVTARASENASATATFVAATRLLLGIELTRISPDPKPSLLPGAFVDIEVEIANTDPLEQHVVTGDDMGFTEAPFNPQVIHGNDGGSINVPAPIGCCPKAASPGSSQVITLTVQAPAHARAGTYTFTLFARVDHNPAVVAQLNLSILVETVTAYSLRLNGNPSQVTAPGGTVTLSGSVVSTGNSQVQVDIEAALFDGAKADRSWTVVITDANGTDLQGRLTLPAYGEVAVNITVTAASGAFNGDKRDLKVTLARAITRTNVWELNPPVTVVVELDAQAVLGRMWQAGFLIILPFVLLALFAAVLGRRALKGPRIAAAPAPLSPATPAAPFKAPPPVK